MLRPILILLLASPLTLAAVEHPPLDEIPDPIGLGPRLALIDYMREQFPDATIEDGATIEQLQEQYLESSGWADAQTHSLDPELTETRRRLYVEFRAVADESLTTAELKALLEKKRAAAAAREADAQQDATEQQGPTVPEVEAERKRAEAQTQDGEGAKPKGDGPPEGGKPPPKGAKPPPPDARAPPPGEQPSSAP